MATRKTPKRLRLRTGEQMRELVSPLRLEILLAIPFGQSRTVAEIAQSLGKTPGPLYYHVRRLEAVGVLRQAGKRPATKKHEVLYERTSQELAMGIDDETGQISEYAVKSAHSALRLARRELDQAVARSAGSPEELRGNELRVMRSKAWLAPREIKELSRHLQAIQDLMRKGTRRAASTAGKKKRGRLFAVTAVVTPLQPAE